MIAIRLWCLLALLSVARCQLEASGGRFGDDGDNTGIDDEDAGDFTYSGMEISGDGNLQQNSTAGVSTTVVVTQTTTTTPRTTTKTVVTTKLQRTTPLVQQVTTTTTTPLAEDENEDDDIDETDVEDETSETDDNQIIKNEPAQTTVASVVEGEDVAPERTTTGTVDIFQYVWSQPGIVAGLIGGAVLGVLFAILLTLFVIYRLRRRNDRTYRKGGSRGSQDETGAFWFDEEDGAAIAYSRASAERYPAHGHPQQAGAYVNPQASTLKAGTSTLRGSQMLTLPPGMGPQAQQPLLYTAPMAPNAQNTYDEYLANLYNQQLYGGYLQQKA